MPSQVLLKIIKHCKESMPELVSGQLLGLDVNDKLEVTHCFPFPSDSSEDDPSSRSNEKDDTSAYQMDMMKCLRGVNVDNNTVGWYQSAFLSSFFSLELIQAQYSYQSEIPNSVCVVYDPFKSRNGRLAIKAYRLTNSFMKLYASGNLSFKNFNKRNVDSTDILEEVPIKVHNSHLVHGFLYEMRENKTMDCGFDRLVIGSNPMTEKSLDLLQTCIDDYAADQNKFQYALRNIARQKQEQQRYLQKLEDENASRVAQGKDKIVQVLLFPLCVR